MSTTLSIHRLQIAREVSRHSDGAVARFLYDKTLLCEAWFARPDYKGISITGPWMSVEIAHAVSIAINMAIDWLAEQS